VITGVIGVLVMPWQLLASADTYIFNWLVYSADGSIAGIMVVDYRLIRRRELDVPDLYRVNGRYAGVKPIAMGALLVGVAPNAPGSRAACRSWAAARTGGTPSTPAMTLHRIHRAAVLYRLGMRRSRFGGRPS